MALRSLLQGLARLILGLIILGMIAWGTLAIYYSDIQWAPLRHGLSLLFGGGSLLGLLLLKPRRRAVLGFLVVFAALLVWWVNIPPSNDRDWQPDVALLPRARIEGSKVTLYNIRDFDYRSEGDYDVHYYDKTFDLDNLRTVDLFLVYWGSPLIAHTILSFGFGDQGYVAVSIETRKEKGEQYSAIRGFFRQYELIYVVADERDVVKLRPNHRGEMTYLYRLNTPVATIRKVFLNYMERINALRDRPEWYNALVLNCTTAIRGNVPYSVRAPWDWRLLLNGYLDRLLYENGSVSTSLPFTDLKRVSLIDTRSRAANDRADYSAFIRDGLPGMRPRQPDSGRTRTQKGEG